MASPALSLRVPLPLVVFCAVCTIAILVNPLPGIDIVIASIMLGTVGHFFLKEKLLLVFLLVRPGIDFLRDIPIYQWRTTNINFNAVISLITMLWIIYTLYQYRSSIQRLPLFLPSLSFLILAGISVIWSVSKSDTIIETLKLGNVLGLFFLSYLFVKHGIISFATLLRTLLYATVLPLAVGAGQLIFGLGITTFSVRGRIYGTFAHPNIFAFVTFFVIALYLDRAWIRPSVFWQMNRVLRLPALLGLVTLLTATYTRIALIALVIFLAIVGILRYRKLLFGLIISVTLFYTLFYPLNTWLNETLNIRLTDNQFIARLTMRDEDADSISWRLALVQENIPVIMARPWLGYGYGTFPSVWNQYRGVIHIYDDSAEAHNDYLRITLELGVIGFIIYTGFLISLFSHFGRIYRYTARHQTALLTVLGTISAFIVISASDNMLYLTPVLWLFFSYWGGSLAELAKAKNTPTFI